MSLLDDLKEKASRYVEQAEQKKDELVEKATVIREKHEEEKRRKTEDWVYRKEAELKALQKTLKEREALIKKREGQA